MCSSHLKALVCTCKALVSPTTGYTDNLPNLHAGAKPISRGALS